MENALILSLLIYFLTVQVIFTVAFTFRDMRREIPFERSSSKVYVAESLMGETMLRDVSQHISLPQVKTVSSPYSNDFFRPHLQYEDGLKNDYIYPSLSLDDRLMTATKNKSVPKQVTVEVLVVFGTSNSKEFNFNATEIMSYVYHFWRRVDETFSNSRNPRIKIKTSETIIHKSLQTEPYMTKAMLGEGQVSEDVLYDFREWLATVRHLKYDAAMLMMSDSVGVMENGHFRGTMAGRGFLGTACTSNGWNSAFVVNYPPEFAGVMTASHELAHILNALHDSQTSCGHTEDIMGGGMRAKFSSCSLKRMRNFARSKRAICLRN